MPSIGMESQNMMAIVDTFAMLAQGVHGHKDALRILGFSTYSFLLRVPFLFSLFWLCFVGLG